MSALDYTKPLKFRNGDRVLTLITEAIYEDGWVRGWCPELENTMSVNPNNIVREDEDA